jgi:hypothetical protein
MPFRKHPRVQNFRVFKLLCFQEQEGKTVIIELLFELGTSQFLSTETPNFVTWRGGGSCRNRRLSTRCVCVNR